MPLDSIVYRLRIEMFSAVFGFKFLKLNKASKLTVNCKKFNIYAACVILMLLAIAGIESNPGPQKTVHDVFLKLEKLEKIIVDIPDIKSAVLNINRDILEMNSDVSTLKQHCDRLSKENDQLKNHLDRLEGFSRRNNLVFYNIQEESGETSNMCEVLIKDIIKTKLKVNVEQYDIERAHRIGRRTANGRPIIVKFWNFKKKLEILSQRRKFKDCNIGVEEDFTVRVRNIRKELKKFLFIARRDGQHAVLQYDKLLVNGRPYTLDVLRRKFENESLENLVSEGEEQIRVQSQVNSTPVRKVQSVSDQSECTKTFQVIEENSSEVASIQSELTPTGVSQIEVIPESSSRREVQAMIHVEGDIPVKKSRNPHYKRPRVNSEGSSRVLRSNTAVAGKTSHLKTAKTSSTPATNSGMRAWLVRDKNTTPSQRKTTSSGSRQLSQ